MGVYNRAFLQQCARTMHIDADTLMQQYPEIFAIQRQDVDFSVGMCTMEVRGAPRPRIKLGSVIIVLAAGAGLLTFFVFMQ